MSDDERQRLRPRQLTDEERSQLLTAERPAHLASIDAAGFPHITPIWFVWDGAAFLMTSLPDRPHVRRLRENPAACVSVDVEDPERDDGERPNRQMRGVGTAILDTDIDGVWTRRITTKYLHGAGARQQADRRSSHPRVVIRLVPEEVVAIGSV